MFLQIILLNKITLGYSNTGVRSVNLIGMRFVLTVWKSGRHDQVSTCQPASLIQRLFLFLLFRFGSSLDPIRVQLCYRNLISIFFVSSYVVFAVQSSLHA